MVDEITLKIISHSCNNSNYSACVGNSYKQTQFNLYKNKDGFPVVYVKDAGYRIKTSDIEIADVRTLIAHESECIRILSFCNFNREALKDLGYELKFGGTYRLCRPLYKYDNDDDYVKYKDYFEAWDVSCEDFILFPVELLKGVNIMVIDFDLERQFEISL